MPRSNTSLAALESRQPNFNLSCKPNSLFIQITIVHTSHLHARVQHKFSLARATAHATSYAYADRRLAAARSVNLAAPPQRPRRDPGLRSCHCHCDSLQPSSPTDISVVRIRIRTTEQSVPVRSSGTRVNVYRTCTSTNPYQ